MQTSTSQLFTGVFMWAVAMFLPSLILYFNDTNPQVSQGMIIVLYPAVLSFVARHASFWVSPYVIMASVMASYIAYMIITLGFKSKDKNFISWIPLSVFIVTLGLVSTQIDMYGPNVAGG
jgi:hypothetical protein